MKMSSRIRAVVTVAAAATAFLALPAAAANAAGNYQISGPWRTTYEDASLDSRHLSEQCVELGGQPIPESDTVVMDVSGSRFQAVMSCTGSEW